MSTGLMHAFDDPPSSVNLQALDYSVNSEKLIKLNIQSPLESVRITKQVSSRPNHKKSYFLYGSHSSVHDFERSRQLMRPESQQLIQPTLIPMDLQSQQPYQKPAIEIISPHYNSQTNYETLAPLSSTGGKTKANQIMIGYLTRRFITKISTSRRRKLFFRSNHFQILGDNATNDELNQLTIHRQQYKMCCNKSILQRGERYKNKLNSLIQKGLKHIPLIYPQSLLKITWDLFLCTVLVYFFILVPIQICFQNQILFFFPLVTLFFMVFLLLDQLVKINTVYYEYGKPVTNRYSILQRYLKNIFLSDSLSIGSIFLAYLNYSSGKPSMIFDFPLLVIYTQFNNFSSIFSYIEESLNLSKFTYSIWSLIKLIMTLLFSEHLFSCFWYFIAAYKEQRGEENWMSEIKINNASWEIKYLDSFYFSTVTMLSVGYGDITPTSKFQYQLIDPLEKIVSIIFMLYACIQLSYSVNTVGMIIQTLQEQRDYLTSKIRLINSFMNKNKVSFDLQYQVREYLRIYLKQQLEKETQEEEQLIDSLSDSLRNRLIFEANNSTLMTCPLFTDHLSSTTKYKLLKQMKQIVINPETIITSWLIDFNEPCLCFIKEGQLNFFLNTRLNPNLGTYKEGEYFGLESFITGQTPYQQYSSQSFVKLIILTRSDFLKTLQENPSDYEEFCMIRDKILLQITEEDKIICQSCNCKGHDLNHCPIVHYKVDREKVIKNHQFCENQHRSYIDRHQKKNLFSALQDQWAISEIAYMIQENEDDRCVFYSKINQMFHNENTQPINLDHDSSRARKNFQRIVRLVSRASYLIKPSKRRLLRKQCVQKLFDINSFNNIQMLSKLLLDANNKDYLAKQEIENLFFLKLRIDSNRIETEYDNQKSYKQYFPENNLEQIIQKESFEHLRQDETVVPSVSANSELRLRNLRISLIQYMLYPHTYFLKYCNSKRIQPQKTPKSKKVDRAKLLMTSFYRHRARVSVVK